MQPTTYTIYTKLLLLTTILLYLIGYLFINLTPTLLATLILIFLIYHKTSFTTNQKSFTITRTPYEHLLFANQPINIQTTLTNHSGPLQITATDHLPNNLTPLRGTNTTTTHLQPQQHLTLDYQLQFPHRGHYTLDTLHLQYNDTLTLFQHHTTNYHTTHFLVHSDPKEITKAKQAATKEHIEITAPALIGTETIEDMEGIRTYLPGDRLKDIEWKATSRLQHLMTKHLQKHNVLDTTILLDCSKTMRRTTGTHSKIHHATNLAIHLTKILQSLHHPIGLIAFDEHKTIKNITPTKNYQHIFTQLTDLPGTIPTNTPTQPITPPLETSEDTEQPYQTQQFLQTIFPFLAQGKRSITHPAQASGIYEAVRLLLHDTKTKHIIILSDLETNIQPLYNSINLIHARKYKIWLLTPFTPYYNLQKNTLTPEQLETAYQQLHIREKTLLKLKKQNIDIVELTPTMEGGPIIEKIRRKQT